MVWAPSSSVASACSRLGFMTFRYRTTSTTTMTTIATIIHHGKPADLARLTVLYAVPPAGHVSVMSLVSKSVLVISTS